MTRLVMLMVAVVAFGCTPKPSEDECRKAIANMLTLMGTEHLAGDEMVESQVRRCKGGSTKKSVQCAINAKTLDDLRACDFYKVPDNARGIGTGGDSAGPAAGSAEPAAGSAEPAAGSATSEPAGTAGAEGGEAPAPGAESTGSGDAGSAGEGSAGADGAGGAN